VRQPFPTLELLAFLLVLALLICNTTAGLASGLAGSLALAASAVLSALAKVLSIQCLNTLHLYVLQRLDCRVLYHAILYPSSFQIHSYHFFIPISLFPY